jgi:hypothetical protein
MRASELAQVFAEAIASPVFYLVAGVAAIGALSLTGETVRSMGYRSALLSRTYIDVPNLMAEIVTLTMFASSAPAS